MQVIFIINVFITRNKIKIIIHCTIINVQLIKKMLIQQIKI